MKTALEIMQLVNLGAQVGAPIVAEILMFIRKPDGTLAIGVIMDQTSVGFKADIEVAQNFLGKK